MQIELSKIKSSPQAIRTTWSEEKMKELVASLSKYGLLQAIKVRPVGEDYEIVYGHRRAEASRRAGLTHIEAVVDGLDDPTALIQGLIENVQREDITDAEEGYAYVRLRDECDLTRREIARLVGTSEDRVGRCLLLVEDEAMSKLAVPRVLGAAGKAAAIRGATKDNAKERETFAAKVVNEGLTDAQTRRVAGALKRTQDPRARELLLETPVADIPTIEQVVKYVVDEEKADLQRWWNDNAGEVSKGLVRLVKRHREEYKEAWTGVERGAVAPEHMPYIEKRLRALGGFLINLADDLDQRRKVAFQ